MIYILLFSITVLKVLILILPWIDHKFHFLQNLTLFDIAYWIAVVISANVLIIDLLRNYGLIPEWDPNQKWFFIACTQILITVMHLATDFTHSMMQTILFELVCLPLCLLLVPVIVI